MIKTIHRSAITGRYVSKEYADKHPGTTVREKQRTLLKKHFTRWLKKLDFLRR